MKYYKQSLLLILLVLFGIVVWYGFSEGLTNLFILPIFAVGIFLTFYFSNEFERDNANRLKKSIQYAKADQEAEKWVEKSLTPDTLRYIKARRWMIILYCLFFFLLASFMWSYLNRGLLIAIKDISYVSVLGILFVLYVLLIPSLFDWIEKRLPKQLLSLIKGDWTRGYLFLLPITFAVYLVYPYEELKLFFVEKLLSFHLFFVVYTFAFVSLYCIVYIYHSMQQEERKRVEQTLKRDITE